jgi:hypothetical protein
MIDDDTEAKRPKDKPMSSTRSHSAQATRPPKPTPVKSHAGSDFDQDDAYGLEGHGFTPKGHGSRKGMRLSLIVLSFGAVCAFGFGLLLELLG